MSSIARSLSWRASQCAKPHGTDSAAWTLRRCLSTASDEIDAWMRDMTARPPVIVSDYLDHQRATHLRNTLPTRFGSASSKLRLASSTPYEAGFPLPHAHHLAYFQPQSILDQLGADGSSTVCSHHLRRITALTSRITTRPRRTRGACGQEGRSSGTRRIRCKLTRP